MKSTIAFCSLLLTSMAWAGTPGLEGTVKDSNGRPVQGATVKIESRSGNFFRTLKTDANGRYSSEGMALGSQYKVTLIVNGTMKAQILNATAREGKAGTLNFDLKPGGKALKRHMVYIPGETGTLIGGGHWVEVDEEGKVVNSDSSTAKIDTMGNGAAQRMQMNNIHSPQGH
jgi:hypothetical protein